MLLKKLKNLLVCLTIALLCTSCSSVPSLSYNPWQVISLPTEATFADLSFTNDENHGWLVGSRGTLFETTDGGDTWQERKIDLGDEKVSYSDISFNGQEGWIVGKPSILLHTDDAGASWSRIPLSSKLPGAPESIIALGPKTAEMVTDLGAIYKTTNGGANWKALVEGAVGVARTITRSPDGRYIAVSAKGNFYSTWTPGDTEWTPHNRNSSRRLQNMGFGSDGRLWLLARGGQVQFSEGEDLENWDEGIFPEFSTSWGLLDLGYRTPEEIWVAGGSANLLRSVDGGVTWEKDRGIEDVASNFYKVTFLTPEKGFVLGNNGVLLKYNPQAEAA
jgi:photosystem II stability/assembly factor-like uncharacterized protein